MGKITQIGRFGGLGEARLKENGIFYENMERTLKYLEILDCDRMLYNFRRAFGVETSAKPLGGWEEPTGLLRGHSTGHFLSALAMAYASTGERIFKDKIDYTVGVLRSLQKMCGGKARDFKTRATSENAGEELWSTNPCEWGEGFLSAYSPDQFALLEQLTKYKKIWAPYYTLHKILAGLIDCFVYAENAEALACAEGIGGWIYDRLSPLAAEHRKEMWSLYIAGEYGGMGDALTRLYGLTDNEIYLETAKMFDNENVFPALFRGEDAIANRHANQHIPQIIGALEEYSATGDEYYRRVGESFFDIVTKNHMYSVGGVGQAESFRDGGKLAANIKEATNCETCAAYNLIKTAALLYALDPMRAEYQDYCERALINQILASQTPFVTENRHNGVTYMLPIGPGEQKEYSDDYDSFTCCHGTGMENHVKYQATAFFETKNAVYVNQYLPCVLDSDVKIDIASDFPRADGKITASGDTDKTVYFRVPAWCGKNPFGLPLDGRYARLEHKAGKVETVDFCFDYAVRFEYTPDEIDGKKLASVLYGPFVMVTEDASKEYIALSPEFQADEKEVSLTCGGRKFIPMYRMHGRSYHTYFFIKS